jgi:hypothetical protein
MQILKANASLERQARIADAWQQIIIVTAELYVTWRQCRMIILAIWSIMLGAVFGRFLKFWALIPVTAAAFAIVCAGSVYDGHRLLHALAGFAILAACLQAGYAFGLLSHLISGGWRRPQQPSKSSRPAMLDFPQKNRAVSNTDQTAAHWSATAASRPTEN